MRESIIQTTINKFLTWLAKKSVTVLYRRTHFWTFSWGLDDNTDLYLMSEESYPDYHRFGVREERIADTPQTTSTPYCVDTSSVCKVDTPQTEQMKTADYCDICKQDMCKGCIADATNPYCVPSHYEINYELKTEPQTDCETCRHYKLACELFSEICKYEPTTQTETQNSNLTFENRTMRDCYNCKRYETESECIECHYEPKDEPQTEREGER